MCCLCSQTGGQEALVSNIFDGQTLSLRNITSKNDSRGKNTPIILSVGTFNTRVYQNYKDSYSLFANSVYKI